jgi:hypothetical protein
MFQVNDYSFLTPEEARKKLLTIANRVYGEQYHSGFFVRDPDPINYLKNELRAYWEGTIREFHGWTDPLGQALQYVYDQLTNWFWGFWRDTIKPGIEWILSGFRWLWDTAKDYAIAAYNKAVQIAGDIWSAAYSAGNWVYEKVSGGISWLEGKLSAARDWIGSRIDYVKDYLGSAWKDLTTRVSGAFETLTGQVAALPQVIASGFQSAISFLGDVLKRVWDETIAPLGQAIKQGAEWFAGILVTAFSNAWDSMMSVLRRVTPITPDRAENVAMSVIAISGLAAAGLIGMTAVWDLIHPFKDVIPGELKAMLYDITGFKIILGGMVSALVGAALFTPLRYLYNYIFQPRLISESEVIEAHRRGIIPPDQTHYLLSCHGYSESQRKIILELAKRVPDERQLREFVWYGGLTREKYEEYLKWLGYPDDIRACFKQLLEPIPPPADLVRFVVREVHLMPPNYETPQFFIDAMKKHGYSDYWSRAYWWSHWVLPAFDQLCQAYFRGIINEKELKQYIQWHDYSPHPRPGISKSDLDIMYELIFELPDKLDLRWMRRWGLISTEEHVQMLKARGYHPQWLERIALAEKMNMLMDERTEVKNAYRSQFLIGMISQQVLQQKLKEVFFTPEETEYLIKAVIERRRYEILREYVDAAVYSYRTGAIDAVELSNRLYSLGLDAEMVQAIVARERSRAVDAKREALQESIYIYGRDIVIKRFREGLTTPEQFESELKAIGYTDRQVPHFRIIAQLERDYDFAISVLNAVKAAYKKKYIDDAKFIEILRSYGFVDEKIQLELALLKLQMRLGVAEVTTT